jgi:hypothetical protein
MSEEQMKNGDILLKILLDAGKPVNTDYYDDLAEVQGLDNKNLIYTRDQLASLGLIEFLDDSRYFVRLSPEGEKAAELGLKKYYQKQEKEANKGHKIAIWAIIATLIVGLLGYITNAFNYLSTLINP